MPRLHRTKKKAIHEAICKSLPHYREWKSGAPVPELAKPYLELLDPVISGYVDGLTPLERKAVNDFLSNWSIDRILKLNYFAKANVNRYTVRTWVYGTWEDGEPTGLVTVMTQAFITQHADFCPFCNRDRFGDGSIHPKLSGTTCPHREMWLEAEAKEAVG